MTLEFDFDTPLIDDKKRKGYNCPCCNSFVKIYCRSFNSNMAFALLFLYRNRERGFIHLENEMLKAGHQRSGDASYLKWYGLIEPKKGEREDGSSRNGFYKITGRGILFAERKTKVHEKFLMHQNKNTGFEGNEIDIVDALGTKFNYQTLFNA